MLTKVLANNFWKIDVEYLDTTEGYVNSIIGNSAGVVIGDRSYDLNGTFQYDGMILLSSGLNILVCHLCLLGCQ